MPDVQSKSAEPRKCWAWWSDGRSHTCDRPDYHRGPCECICGANPGSNERGSES